MIHSCTYPRSLALSPTPFHCFLFPFTLPDFASHLWPKPTVELYGSHGCTPQPESEPCSCATPQPMLNPGACQRPGTLHNPHLTSDPERNTIPGFYPCPLSPSPVSFDPTPSIMTPAPRVPTAMLSALGWNAVQETSRPRDHVRRVWGSLEMQWGYMEHHDPGMDSALPGICQQACQQQSKQQPWSTVTEALQTAPLQ